LVEEKKLSQENLKQIINTSKSEDVLKQMLEHQVLRGDTQQEIIKKCDSEILKDLFWNQKLTRDSIERAIERGEQLNTLIQHEKERFDERLISKLIDKGVNLHEAYEQLTLTSKNIDKAIEKGIELESLVSNQSLEEHHFDKLIDLEQHLSLLLTKENVIEEQKERIYGILSAKYGYEGKREGKILSKIPPEIDVVQFLEIYNDAVNQKIKDNPLEEIVGVYPFPLHNKWSEIKDLVEKDGYHFREDNVTYVYKGNDKQRLGKFLSKKNPDLMKFLTTVTDEEKHKALFPTDFNPSDYEFVISNDPSDIAIRSTSMKHVQIDKCEAIGHQFGWPINRKHYSKYGCGWCDDIKANNLVAYLRHKDKPDEWYARAAIRWCNRKDDGLPDVFVEQIYTKKGEMREMMKETIEGILTEQGFNPGFYWNKGTVKCVTPYKFSGYVDSDSVQSGSHDYLSLLVSEKQTKEESE
jgi:hypothetical protein